MENLIFFCEKSIDKILNIKGLSKNKTATNGSRIF